MAITGVSAYAQYGKEAVAYGTEAAAMVTSFGKDLSVTTELINNFIESRNLNDRNVVNYLEGNFEGSVTIEGDLGTTHWIAAAFGTSASSGSTPYSHTYSEFDVLPSITIDIGKDLSTDSIRKLLGCKLQESNISGAIGEKMRFRLTFLYKTETEGTTIDSTPSSDAETPFIFAQASVERPNGSTLTNVQRFSYTLANNLIRVYGAGSRFQTDLLAGPRNHSFEYDRAVSSSSELEAAYGSATAPNATIAETTLDFNVTNGLTNASERHLQITLGSGKFERHTDPIRPNELIVETISGVAMTGTAIGQDATATTIFD